MQVNREEREGARRKLAVPMEKIAGIAR